MDSIVEVPQFNSAEQQLLLNYRVSTHLLPRIQIASLLLINFFTLYTSQSGSLLSAQTDHLNLISVISFCFFALVLFICLCMNKPNAFLGSAKLTAGNFILLVYNSFLMIVTSVKACLVMCGWLAKKRAMSLRREKNESMMRGDRENLDASLRPGTRLTFLTAQYTVPVALGTVIVFVEHRWHWNAYCFFLNSTDWLNWLVLRTLASKTRAGKCLFVVHFVCFCSFSIILQTTAAASLPSPSSASFVLLHFTLSASDD